MMSMILLNSIYLIGQGKKLLQKTGMRSSFSALLSPSERFAQHPSKPYFTLTSCPGQML